MSGPVEETGKIASGIVEALRLQPLMLVLLLLNVAFIGAIFWSVKDSRERIHSDFSIVLQQLGQAQELLAKCIIPERRTDNQGSDKTGLIIPLH